MSEKSFKFVSPGVQIQEIDNSQVPVEAQEIGPVIIGRAQRGPAMRPVKVSSFSEFIEVFGEATSGAEYSDVWRDNNVLGPAYGVLAAQSSLKNKPSLTYIRLLGTEHPEADSSNGGEAGFIIGGSQSSIITGGPGGAYGLFIFPSSSTDTVVTGTLGAVFYCATGSVTLSGNFYQRNPAAVDVEGTGTAAMILSNDDKEFRVFVKNTDNSISDDLRFNFDPSSDKFIRRVANTNPTRLNSSLYSTTKNYFLGETFEDFIYNADSMAGLRNASKWFGVIFGMKNTSTSDSLADRQLPAQASKTGWFFSQDMVTTGGAANPHYSYDLMQKLFRFHSLESGEWNQCNIKISLRNIKVSTNDYDRFGTFDVLIRQLSDSDDSMVILEQFTNCDLNPLSPNYLAKKIGDKYVTFDTATNKNVEVGEFDNRSRFVRVEMAEAVASQAAIPELLPFGVYGPPKFKDTAFASGTWTSNFGTITNVQVAYTTPFVAAHSIPNRILTGTGGNGNGSVFWGDISHPNTTASIIFPHARMRKDTLTGNLSSPKSAFWGLYTDDSNLKFSKAIRDLTKVMPVGVDSFTPDSAEGTDYQYIFTLDDLKYVSSPGDGYDVEWSSGSRLAGTSITSLGDNTYNSVLTGGYNAYTTLLAGGFDGFDVREIEPFNNADLSGKTAKTSYAFNTIQRAIELLRDPEYVEFNVAAVPGVNNSSLTSRLIEVCEERGDAVAIIDIEDDFTARAENSNTLESRRPNITNAISSLKSRGLNSSYGAAFFPWVQIREPISGQLLSVPPSVSILGVLAYNDKVGAPWFAPAGFNRGSLSAGHGGIPVTNVTLKLNKADRDKLYAANINPIGVLDGEIVVFGQKTLQVRASALDRLNVRRALIDIKKKISKIAATMIFEPNVRKTWDLFRNRAEPLLRDIVARNGLSEYKLKLDTDTTTPDLIDRNIVYGKLFLKPVRAIEFIGFDFNITNSGANFSDL